MVDSVAVSTVDDAFLKGFNSEKSEVSEVVSTAVTASESVTQPAVSVAETTAKSSAETQATSAVDTVTGSVATSSAVSAVDYEQKWKSVNGIVRSQSQQLSAAKSENESLRASHSTPTSQAASAASSEVDHTDALEEKYMDALAEGDKVEAKKIRREIDKIKEDRLRGSIGKEVQTATVATLTAKDEETATMQVVSESYKMYPYLNNTAPEANEKAIRFVRATAAEYMEQGHPKPEAIRLAVSEAVPIFGSASVATSVVASSAATSQVDDAKMRAMAGVDSKTRPVKTSQKAKGTGSFEDGFNAA